MKIEFNPKDFLRKFRLVAGVSAKRYVRAILMNVKIVAHKKHGTFLMATDTELGIRVHVDTDVPESGSVIVPPKWLIQVLTRVKDGRAMIESDAQTITVASKTGTVTTPVTSHEDEFPNVESFAESNYYAVESDMLATVIKRTVFATDKDAIKHACSGVALQSDNGRLFAIATNGTCLVAQEWYAQTIGKSTLRYAEKPAIVPTNVLNLLSKVLKDKAVMESCESTVSMAVNTDHVKFQCGDVTLFSRLIDGKFPHWKSAVPKTKNAPCVVDRDDLFSVLRRMEICTTDLCPCVLLTFEHDRLTLSARSVGVGRCTEVVSKTGYKGEKRTVKLHCKPLIDMLTAITGAVLIHCSEDDENVVKFTAGDLTYVHKSQELRLEETDESEWERLQTIYRNDELRSRLR